MTALTDPFIGMVAGILMKYVVALVGV
jgi:hypothetical protein